MAAFNARDLEALAECLAPDAKARVEGAPFPEEVGRETIRDTSLAYLLGEDARLHAEAVDHPEVSVVLFDGRGRLDVAIEFEESDGLAVSLTYYTVPNAPERLAAIASDLGRPLADS